MNYIYKEKKRTNYKCEGEQCGEERRWREKYWEKWGKKCGGKSHILQKQKVEKIKVKLYFGYVKQLDLIDSNAAHIYIYNRWLT